ncbi:MAG: anion-transporting ArsA/GET3 family ATPase [Hyphomicrobiaceae bacterium]|jgi:anion-transporting  ArsA/GET3 family ATPase
MSSARLEFVVGKGGVGKSTVAAAIAVSRSDAGLRTLVIELGGPGGVARILGVEPSEANTPTPASAKLEVMYIEGDSALAEYLALVVPVRRVLRAVFDSTAYRTFVAAAPGLKELMTVGKIWYEATREKAGRPVWDVVVIDAGASGHSLQYLEMPQAAARTFSSGLVHREAERVSTLLSDPNTTSVHVVATPEDMPLVEASEIIASLARLGLPLGTVFVNRCRNPLPEGSEMAVEILGAQAATDGEGSVVAGLWDVSRAVLAWHVVQEAGIELLMAETGCPVSRLPLLAVEEFGTAELARLAVAVGEVVDPRDEVCE